MTDERIALGRLRAAEVKLQQTTQALFEVCKADGGARPTINTLGRRMSQVATRLRVHEEAHEAHRGQLEAGSKRDAADSDFAWHYGVAQDALDAAHAILEDRDEKAAREARAATARLLNYTLKQRDGS